MVWCVVVLGDVVGCVGVVIGWGMVFVMLLFWVGCNYFFV